MEISEKYAPEIWEKICRLPFMVAIGMEGAGHSGLAGSARERQATLHSILAARTEFPGNPLVNAILSVHAEEEQALLAVMERHDAALEFLAESGVQSARALWERILDCIREVLPALEKREAGHTITDYTAWLRQIAERVALAAKEGDFLGMGGVRFSKEEQEYFRRLEATLQEFDRTS
jgi:hypothetical protein